jgi:hypothetical protein
MCPLPHRFRISQLKVVYYFVALLVVVWYERYAGRFYYIRLEC